MGMAGAWSGWHALRAAFFVGGAAYPWWDPDEKL